MDRSASQVVLDERRGFKRAADGTIEVRRAFGSDAVAFALAIVVPIAYLVLLRLLLVLLFKALPDGNAFRVDR